MADTKEPKFVSSAMIAARNKFDEWRKTIFNLLKNSQFCIDFLTTFIIPKMEKCHERNIAMRFTILRGDPDFVKIAHMFMFCHHVNVTRDKDGDIRIEYDPYPHIADDYYDIRQLVPYQDDMPPVAREILNSLWASSGTIAEVQLCSDFKNPPSGAKVYEPQDLAQIIDSINKWNTEVLIPFAKQHPERARSHITLDVCLEKSIGLYHLYWNKK